MVDDDARARANEAPLAPRLAGLAELRRARGEERARFNDVADHIVDFVAEHPDAAQSLDSFAAFLAAVERIDHAHDGSGASTVASNPRGRR